MSATRPALTAEEIKACCSASYASDAARWLLGDSFHPGGAALTSRLARALDVGPAATVLDLASGPGTSALQVARETGCSVIGVDLSPDSVAGAERAAEAAGESARVCFLVGDAEALELEDASVDGVVCECSLCLFPDKARAVAEIARVLRPGGRLVLSDVTADTARLPEELRSVVAWVSCLADARSLAGLAGLLEQGGLIVEETEAHDGAFVDLLDRVEGRLRLARMLRFGLPATLRDRVGRGLELCAAARGAVADGTLGYGVVIARRP